MGDEAAVVDCSDSINGAQCRRMTVVFEALQGKDWDFVIVGAGMGGAVTGLRLAQAGLSVLFIEKGYARTNNSLTGAYAETFFPTEDVAGAQHQAILMAAGRAAAPLEDISGKRPRLFVPFVGSGAGGSSALFGMALERFMPADFTPRSNFPGITDSTLTERWPITYDELAPYYTQAESLFGVRGGADPLRTGAPLTLGEPPPLTPAGNELFGFLQGRGLHPYRMPMACEFVPGCACCQGYLCPRPCKNDSTRICLDRAVEQHGAKLMDSCEVLRLEASRDRVTSLHCTRNGNEFSIHGKTVILAAGSLASPAILLRSAAPAWPDGLANRSGMVGRNLMRHLIDLYAVRPNTREPSDNRRKELAFNDFYFHNGIKLGSVQSFGRLPPPGLLTAHLQADIGELLGTWAKSAFHLAKPLLKRVLKPMVENHLVLAGMIEDLPYSDNQVTLAPSGGIRIRYRLHNEATARVKLQRRLISDSLRHYPVRLIKQAENNERIAHACGTCRFGDAPETSVLNRDNRAHELENLYIVDSSFFPSSAGTNPALTIAANALRVADTILATGR